MATPKIEQLDLREAPPQGGTSLQEYLAIFRKEGRVDVPSPDGMGVYTISMECGGYYVPRLLWKSYVKDDYDRHSPSCLKTNKGREILWYPKGLGTNYGADARPKYPSDEEFFIAMAKMVIGFIISGRQLYTLRCGANINSLNNNDNHNERYYY